MSDLGKPSAANSILVWDGTKWISTLTSSLTGLPSRVTALDSNHLHAWELTESSGAVSFVDSGLGAALHNIPINTGTGITLGSVGLMGTCPMFGLASDGSVSTTYDASLAVSSFSDLPSTIWTIDLWFRAAIDPVSAFLFGSTATGGSNVVLYLNTSNFINVTVRTANNFWDFSTSISYVYRNQWNYMALTYDGSNLRLYLNGELMKTQATTGATNWTNGTTPKIEIGKDTNGGSGAGVFTGQISRIRMSNIARSLTYIRSVYKTGMYY